MSKRSNMRPPLQEFVIGLVAPVGTDFDHICELLAETLKGHGYETSNYHVSEFLKDEGLTKACGYRLRYRPEYTRLTTHMKAGTLLREKSGRGDILALYAASQIFDTRPDDKEGNPMPLTKRVHVIRSLKHPDEVKALRQIYRHGFFQLSIHCAVETCINFLMKRKGLSDEQAITVMERDRHEGNLLGQRMRDVFELGDVFLEYSTDKDVFQESLRRAVDLIFGSPYETPTRHEHAMFVAYAASLRSGDLNRQVGAVIMSEHGDILATGANDVPCFGGGQYWPGPNDMRDHIWGVDSNEREKRELVAGVIRKIVPGSRGSSDALFVKFEDKLKGTGILRITEYGRSVHAEMEALSSCLRNGISVRGCSLYSTTFPCHNCAKHIVSAGIREVHYVEPYPKSRAVELHPDAISLAESGEKLVFKPFVGVGPRRYVDLFSLKLGSGRPLHRQHSNGTILKRDEWKNQGPRVPMIPLTYIEEEQNAADDVAEFLE